MLMIEVEAQKKFKNTPILDLNNILVPVENVPAAAYAESMDPTA